MSPAPAHPPSAEALASFLPRFGLETFRVGQDRVIESVAGGGDVLCVMPTGGGKSLCYQLPTLARDGLTLVVSPLIALMKDQVDALRRKGIAAELLNSTLSPAEQDAVMDRMRGRETSFVYVAPERMRHTRFLDNLRDVDVSMLAVDEAHCVSEWGHDFRPDYGRLGAFRRRHLPETQCVALTATATPTVRDDIIASLQMDSPEVFVTGFGRKNLHLSVTASANESQRIDQLKTFLADRDGQAGIIYAATRKRCEEIGGVLSAETKFKAAVYHAGLEPPVRRSVQEAFMAGEVPVIIATNAFGMGIDKPDIRFVVHYNMPGTLEAYYQEAGRAGRDGGESDCRLLFAAQDRGIQEFFIDNRYPSRDAVKKVHAFLTSREEDPIELTLEQVREAVDLDTGPEAVGTAETLLARAGVLRRLDSSAGAMMVRLDTDDLNVVDRLPKEARVRRRVLTAVAKVVGARRGEDVYVTPRRLEELTDMDRTKLMRTLRELRNLRCFDYVPPFRGRGIHIVDRRTPFEKLDIDFDLLDRRKATDLEKLDRVVAFANTGRCRQTVILDYFGEPDPQPCGSCDRCDAAAATENLDPVQAVAAVAPKTVDAADLLRGLRIILSGVARTHGRFGRHLVAQMLAGSKSSKLVGMKLHRISTYGLLAAMRQGEIVEAMDAMAAAGLLTQIEADRGRPTINVTELGREVMMGRAGVPPTLDLGARIAARLAAAASKIEGGDVETESAGQDEDREASQSPTEPDPLTEQLESSLRRFRQRSAAALDIPAYRVLTNATLARVAAARPTTTEQLEAISGIGPATVEQFGYDLVELIRGTIEDSDGDPPTSRPLSAVDAPSAAAQPSEADDPLPAAASTGESPTADGLDSPAAKADAGNPGETASVVEPEPAPPPPDWHWTVRLLTDDYPLAEVAAMRRKTVKQIQTDLRMAAAAGEDIPEPWVVACRSAMV